MRIESSSDVTRVLAPGTKPGAGRGTVAADAGLASTPPARTAAPASTTPPLRPARLTTRHPRETQVNIADSFPADSRHNANTAGQTALRVDLGEVSPTHRRRRFYDAPYGED